MARWFRALTVLLALAWAIGPPAFAAEEEHQGGTLFDRALQTIVHHLPSQRMSLQKEAPAWRTRARAATTLAEERAILFDFLALIPSSHVALLSGHGNRALSSDLHVRKRRGLGLEVIQLAEGYFVASVFRGSPADEAGVRRGDRLLRIDEEDVESSARLDHRTDDAHLPDPPAHLLLCEPGDSISLELRRAPDSELLRVSLTPRVYRAIDLDRAAVRVVGPQGARIGILPLTLMYRQGMDALVSEALDGPLAEADAVVFDVRGHGGYAHAVWQALAAMRRDARIRGRPFVFLADARTRSAKEMLLQQVRTTGLGSIVGEHTAGAVRPCRFLFVGQDTWLMCPVQDLDRHFTLELVGLAPDVAVASQLPYAAGLDPIFEFGVLVALEQIGAAALR